MTAGATSDTSPAGRPHILGRQIVHVSYEVPDIPAAVDAWVSTFGAGPFFLLERQVFDQVTHNGAPAAWDHSAAFGQWGPIGVELQHTYEISPEDTLRPAIVGRGNAPNHVAYVSADPVGESTRLEQLGFPQVLFAQSGPVELRFHYVPLLGHAIEIHKESPFLLDFFAMIAKAAQGWDGTDPLRTP
jgi:hypothetical protein